MEEGPSYTLREALPRSVWRRFQRAPRAGSDEDESIGRRNGFIGTHQLTAAAAAAAAAVGTKRRSRGGEQQQAQGTEKEKKSRLFTDYDNNDMHTLPSFFTEYTADDVARFAEDMAHTDKLLDEVAAMLDEGVVPNLPPSWSPCLLELEEEEERRDGGQRVPGRVPAATIKMFRAFTTTRFHPISERFLSDPCLFNEDVAQEIRETDRFISKVYAWAQERAAEAADEYDAKGYLECNADGTININLPATSAPN